MPKVTTKATQTKAESSKRSTKRQIETSGAEKAPVTGGTTGDATADPATWRASKVGADTKISKTIAVAQYRLKAKDFEGLSFEKKRTVAAGRAVDMYLYIECDVERRAWERHGGPEAFEAYLAKLRERHVKKNGKSASFTQPASYEDPKDSAQYDHTISSAALRRAKEETAPWLWQAFNDALDEYRAEGWYGPDFTFKRPRDREGPITSALKLAKSYPPRPAQLLPPSPAVDALRAVLAEAAGLADIDGEWGKDVPGLYFCTSHFPEYVEWYEWSGEYSSRVYTALSGVVVAHGVGDDGWASARWEVYDRYVESMKKPTEYDSRDARWLDEVAEWLDGRLAGNHLTSWSWRGRSEAGRRYNDLLPFLHPQGARLVGFPQN